MSVSEPTAKLDARFSSDQATPVPWTRVRELLDAAEVFWLTTVRADGRPHATPLLAIWLDGALCFCTGETEQKARNLVGNPRVILATGCNTLDDGFDVVVEGEAIRLTDDEPLRRLADAYAAKYEWPYTVADGVLVGDAGNQALVFAVRPTVVFGFGKGEPFSQTRYRFAPAG